MVQDGPDFPHFCNELGLRDLKNKGKSLFPKISNFVFVKDEEGPNVAENWLVQCPSAECVSQSN